MFGFGKKKKVIEELKKDIGKSFNSIKQDFQKVGDWIEHIDGKHGEHLEDLDLLKSEILLLKEDINDIKNAISFFEPGQKKGLSKQPQTAVHKHLGVEVVQTPVQTAVQTAILNELTVMERSIVWVLVNAEVNLSYEDLSAMLGKSKSTIRGQINTIKQKSEGLIEEYQEKNGKKRVFIPEEMKKLVLKSAKVRVNKKRK